MAARTAFGQGPGASGHLRVGPAEFRFSKTGGADFRSRVDPRGRPKDAISSERPYRPVSRANIDRLGSGEPGVEFARSETATERLMRA